VTRPPPEGTSWGLIGDCLSWWDRSRQLGAGG